MSELELVESREAESQEEGRRQHDRNRIDLLRSARHSREGYHVGAGTHEKKTQRIPQKQCEHRRPAGDGLTLERSERGAARGRPRRGGIVLNVPGLSRAGSPECLHFLREAWYHIRSATQRRRSCQGWLFFRFSVRDPWIKQKALCTLQRPAGSNRKHGSGAVAICSGRDGGRSRDARTVRVLEARVRRPDDP